MKAWIVNEKDEFDAAVVFAETRGKAKALALKTLCCQVGDFCNIEVLRVPQCDRYYKTGKTNLDWENPNDRIILVKECGFRCDAESKEDCEKCSAKNFCDYYSDKMKKLQKPKQQ